MNEKSKKLKRLILLLTKTTSVDSNGMYSSPKFGFNFNVVENLENIETDMTFEDANEASECISDIVGANHKNDALNKITESATEQNIDTSGKITLRFHA